MKRLLMLFTVVAVMAAMMAATAAPAFAQGYSTLGEDVANGVASAWGWYWNGFMWVQCRVVDCPSW